MVTVKMFYDEVLTRHAMVTFLNFTYINVNKHLNEM
jgi:hypothetical protein